MTLSRTIPLAKHWLDDSTANGRGVVNYLAGIAITRDNKHAWVVGKKDNTDRGTLVSPAMSLVQDNTVRAQLVVIDLSTNAEDRSLRMDIDNSDSPTAIVFSPAGDYAFLALQGNNQIGIVDMLDFLRGDSPKGMISRLGVGLAPQGLAIDASTGRLFSANFMGRSVTSIGMNPLFTSGSLNLPSTTISAVANEALSPQVLSGKRIFYNAGDKRMSAEGYMSCATCHADGGHDGRTWDFTQRGEGLRNTTDLRGRRGLGHGAVHWSGNFDEIQDFENDIRNGFGGTGFMSDADFAATSNPLGTAKAGRNAELDAMAAYVASLGASTLPKSPARQANGAATAASTAGRAIFEAENCMSCHKPSMGFIDRLPHDVGTLRTTSGSRLGSALTGIDTPTLLGLHATAPYLHDGSAASLEQVFSQVGGTLLQAESGVMVGGATAGDIAWSNVKNWYGSQMVTCDKPGMGVSFTGLDGGTGGAGAVGIRFSSGSYGGNLEVVVNGVVINLDLPATPNDPGYLPTLWQMIYVPVTYASGTANTILLRRPTTSIRGVFLDAVLFSTPLAYEKAAPHRRVLALSAANRASLLEYLRSLDATDSFEPEIVVKRGTVLLTNGGTDNPGAIAIGTRQTLTYTIANAGTAPLTFSGFALSGITGCTAEITTAAVSPIANAGVTTLEVAVTPITSTWSFVVNSLTNDADENPCNWSVAGAGTVVSTTGGTTSTGTTSGDTSTGGGTGGNPVGEESSSGGGCGLGSGFAALILAVVLTTKLRNRGERMD